MYGHRPKGALIQAPEKTKSLPIRAHPAAPVHSAASPAKRVAAESEEIPTRVQFSPQGGNGTVVGISELVRVWGLEPLLKILKTIENKGLYFVCV